jgi:hypothetical protein
MRIIALSTVALSVGVVGAVQAQQEPQHDVTALAQTLRLVLTLLYPQARR